jgi:hypothetical protein
MSPSEHIKQEAQAYRMLLAPKEQNVKNKPQSSHPLSCHGASKLGLAGCDLELESTQHDHLL